LSYFEFNMVYSILPKTPLSHYLQTTSLFITTASRSFIPNTLASPTFLKDHTSTTLIPFLYSQFSILTELDYLSRQRMLRSVLFSYTLYYEPNVKANYIECYPVLPKIWGQSFLNSLVLNVGPRAPVIWVR
jgi:hypothetical protein